MPVSDLTPSAQDYLKFIWSAAEWSKEDVTIGRIAGGLGLGASTVSQGVRKLADRGFVTHARYGSIELTPAGRDLAVMMVRRHRLLETFLVQVLGYGWDEIHHEAEVLEHAVSEAFLARIDELLGHPVRDPHGDPIPSPNGAYHRAEAQQLTAAGPGNRVTIYRVSDADAGLLRYLAGLGLTPGTELVIEERGTFSPGPTVRATGQDQDITLGTQASDAVWVIPSPLH
ncbi:metal-dependent transcriptional regulator (plasmid) [Arthrobacter sp. FW305-BF8]|uniref:metal-dependent transcriptional regulator n=1 Tax=Arthrobacter sp. FW305-BF8 TaxID=2879617 RepID=UPI001F3A6B91|nr:metal-dependent transcriptional regulator [Arthrobacter sp. FW305-BF8]UKA56640.1 metal-dependent transcriptional regulator [Arthrobacter sp. FW305-BF8]